MHGILDFVFNHGRCHPSASHRGTASHGCTAWQFRRRLYPFFLCLSDRMALRRHLLCAGSRYLCQPAGIFLVLDQYRCTDTGDFHHPFGAVIQPPLIRRSGRLFQNRSITDGDFRGVDPWRGRHATNRGGHCNWGICHGDACLCQNPIFSGSYRRKHPQSANGNRAGGRSVFGILYGLLRRRAQRNGRWHSHW